MSSSLRSSEDAFVKWATTGKFQATDLFNTIAEEALRAAYRMAVIKPLFGGDSGGGIFGSLLGDIGSSIFGSLFGGGGSGFASSPNIDPTFSNQLQDVWGVSVKHDGGMSGDAGGRYRYIHPAYFDDARRLHGGGMGLANDEEPVIIQKGEGVFTPRQMDNAGALLSSALSAAGRGGQLDIVVHGDFQAQMRHEETRGPNGEARLDIFIEQIEDRMGERILKGEGLFPYLNEATGIERQAGPWR
jgi:hypothetical protein